MPLLNSMSHSQLLGSRGVFLGYRPFISSVGLSSTNINEGGSLTITVNTINVPNYTTISYTIAGISAGDVASGNLSGTLNILNNQATSSITLTFAEDYLLEGDETITITFTLSQRASYTVQATLADFSRPTFEITYEPSDASVIFYGNTSFGVDMAPINSGSNTYTFQWQRSINSGVSWANLVNGSTFSGCTSNSLIVEKWSADYTTNFQNALFRCIVKDAINSYTLVSRAASLAVTAPPYGAVIVAAASSSVSWTVPNNVYAISAVLVGGGGGGGGSYVNPNYWEGAVGGGGGGGSTVATGLLKVQPGETLTLRAGLGGTAGSATSVNTITVAGNGVSSFITFPATGNASMSGTITAGGGTGGGANSFSQTTRPSSLQYRYGSRGPGGFVTIGTNITLYRSITGNLTGSGGTGGLGAIGISGSSSFYLSSGDSRAGGGAGGYGSSGGSGADSSSIGSGLAGLRGGGGGGAGCGVANASTNYAGANNAGGGVGIFGEGTNGAGGTPGSLPFGRGGSGGANGSSVGGGTYGGGGQAMQTLGKPGGNGAIRIIFGLGTNTTTLRSYSANNDTANQSNTVAL